MATERNIKDVLAVAAALSDETRLRALALLRGRELCVCQLIEVFGLAPSTISKHMTILHHAGLVERRKQGRWRYYRLAGPSEAMPAAWGALEWLADVITEGEMIVEDAVRCDALCGEEGDEADACEASVNHAKV